MFNKDSAQDHVPNLVSQKEKGKKKEICQMSTDREIFFHGYTDDRVFFIILRKPIECMHCMIVRSWEKVVALMFACPKPFPLCTKSFFFQRF